MIAGASLLVSWGAAPGRAAVVYVNASASGANNGAAWSDAFNGLQSALTAAAAGDEIWVAAGTYKPTSARGDRAATFLLKNGVALYGGFVGTETMLSQRDWDANPTVLSGDIAGDDGPNFAGSAENSIHVVTALAVDDTAVLDGFTVLGGRADGPGFGAVPQSQEQGSGVNIYVATPRLLNCTFRGNWNGNHGAVNDHGDTTLINCTFRDNHSETLGAGLYSHHHSMTLAIGCTFMHNTTAGDGAGAYSRSEHGATYIDCTFIGNSANQGGGMYNAADSVSVLTGCTFIDNTAVTGGGGLYNDECSPTITDCEFTDNDAGLGATGGDAGGGGSGGGGIWNSGGAAVIGGCSFTHNSASFGAGVYNITFSVAHISNCTFTDNSANEAGGLYTLNSDVTVTDCVFTHNTAAHGAFSVGGGLSNYYSNSIVDGCTFHENSGELGGGGLYNEGETPVVSNCTFVHNHTTGATEGWGGGLLNGYFTAARLSNCAFVGNTANRGGGIFNLVFSTPTIVNCTLSGNSAGVGGAIQTYSGSGPAIANCVAWGNTPSQLDGAPMNVGHSCVQGGYNGDGNIAGDPRFVRAPNAGADGVVGTDDDDDGDLRLRPASPCIDAGANAALPAEIAHDLGGGPRFVDDCATNDSGVGRAPLVDMGAFEFEGSTCSAVTIVAANPPALSPFGRGVFRDVLDTGSGVQLGAGIGGVATPASGPVMYARISVRFDATPAPELAPANIAVSCTDLGGNGAGDCPMVVAVEGAGAGPYLLTLDRVIPPRECTTLVFPGTAPGQKLQFQSLPGDVDLNGTTNHQDLTALVHARNDGSANLPANLPRYNINRRDGVDARDIVRLVQLLNGATTTQVFNGATVAGCP